MEEQVNHFWHYTPAIRLAEIFDSGEIKLEAGHPDFSAKKAVWVSTNPRWEPTATKMVSDDNGNPIQLTDVEMLFSMGLGRIRVQPPPEGFFTWKKYKQTSGIKVDLWKTLSKLGEKRGGNSKEWFGSYEPIKKDQWVSIEMVIGEEWVKCQDLSNISAFVEDGMKRNQEFFNVLYPEQEHIEDNYDEAIDLNKVYSEKERNR